MATISRYISLTFSGVTFASRPINTSIAHAPAPLILLLSASLKKLEVVFYLRTNEGEPDETIWAYATGSHNTPIRMIDLIVT